MEHILLHSAGDDCPGCKRRQQLLNQAGSMADTWKAKYMALAALVNDRIPELTQPAPIKKESGPAPRTLERAA